MTPSSWQLSLGMRIMSRRKRVISGSYFLANLLISFTFKALILVRSFLLSRSFLYHLLRSHANFRRRLFDTTIS